jgi:hypothetical protein
MTTHVGFTGSQHGMTDRQADAVCRLLIKLPDKDSPARRGWYYPRLHHGDCIGADAQVHELAYQLGYTITIHPPLDPVKRAFCHAPKRSILKPLDYMQRNEAIVAAASVLVAAPQLPEAKAFRSGTWATIRRARRKIIPIHICWPDGTITTVGSPN